MPWRAILGPSPRNVLYVATLIGAAQTMAGVCILRSPAAGHVSAYSALRDLLEMGSLESALGGLLILVGLAAIAGGTVPLELPHRLWLLLPQTLVLSFTVLSFSRSFIAGEYPDGYVPNGGSDFLLTDHNIAWIVCIMQIVELVSLAIRQTREP